MLSGFELYLRWVPLLDVHLFNFLEINYETL